MEMVNAKGHRIEDVRIQREMERLSPSLARISGVLLPDQDMVNFFAIDTTRRQQGCPTYTPFATGGPTSGRLMPSGPSFRRSHCLWKRLRKTH